MEIEYFCRRLKSNGLFHAVLPYPPSANVYWRATCRGGYPILYTSAAAKKFKADVQHICGFTEPTSERVGFFLDIYVSRTNADSSNRIKVLEDALEGIFYLDDKQIYYHQVIKHIDRKAPRAVVTVMLYDDIQPHAIRYPRES